GRRRGARPREPGGRRPGGGTGAIGIAGVEQAAFRPGETTAGNAYTILPASAEQRSDRRRRPARGGRPRDQLPAAGGDARGPAPNTPHVVGPPVGPRTQRRQIATSKACRRVPTATAPRRSGIVLPRSEATGSGSASSGGG